MVTVSDICKKTSKKKAAVSLFLSRNGISAEAKSGHHKYYDESAEPLRSYMGGINESVENKSVESEHKIESADKTVKKQAAGAVNAKSLTPLNDFLSDKLKSSQPDTIVYGNVLKSASEISDLGAQLQVARDISKERVSSLRLQFERELSEAKMLKAQAEADKARLENEARRGELIERREVMRQWGRVSAVINKQILPVGLKLSTQICSALKANDTKTRLEVQKIIDDEIYAACENTNRELVGLD